MVDEIHRKNKNKSLRFDLQTAAPSHSAEEKDIFTRKLITREYLYKQDDSQILLNSTLHLNRRVYLVNITF